MGSVTAETIVKNEQDEIIRKLRGVWILTVNQLDERRSELVGNPGKSMDAISIKARVHAWLAGGPLPKLDDVDWQTGQKTKVLMYETED